MANIDLLPEFDGTSKCNLDYFLVQCETFLRNFQRAPESANSAMTNTFLFHVVKSKIRGNAQSVLDVETNLSFTKLKEKLIRKYGDARDEHILAREISNCSQQHNEDFQMYHERLNHLLIKYICTLKLNYETPVLEMKLREAEEKTLSVFRVGVLPPYREYLRYMQLADLSHALRACRNYDNERAYETYMDVVRSGPKFIPLAPRSHFYQPPAFGVRNNSFENPRNFVNPPTRQPRPQLWSSNNQFQDQRLNRQEPARSSQHATLQNPPPPGQYRPAPVRTSQNSQRPYPAPQQVGRIHAPTPQERGNFPRPMSGISTIRNAVNHHIEAPYEQYVQYQDNEDPHDTSPHCHYDYQNSVFYNDEEKFLNTYQHGGEETKSPQDFRFAPSSRSKT